MGTAGEVERSCKEAANLLNSNPRYMPDRRKVTLEYGAAGADLFLKASRSGNGGINPPSL
jgi:hypothetical protein